MKKHSLIALATLLIASSASLAKNTDKDWKWENTYYKTYGEWTTACEDRAEDPAIKRCYLRYVDVYAQDPFGALFVFVTTTVKGPSFSFEFERGTSFTADWTVSGTSWAFNPDDCPFFGDCILDQKTSASLAKTLGAPGAALNFKFTDSAGRDLNRTWPGDQQFADAFRDLQQQTATRGLN